MCQILYCCIIQGVSFIHHHRNVRSRVSKFEPGLGLGGYGLDYITGCFTDVGSILKNLTLKYFFEKSGFKEKM